MRLLLAAMCCVLSACTHRGYTQPDAGKLESTVLAKPFVLPNGGRAAIYSYAHNWQGDYRLDSEDKPEARNVYVTRSGTVFSIILASSWTGSGVTTKVAVVDHTDRDRSQVVFLENLDYRGGQAVALGFRGDGCVTMTGGRQGTRVNVQADNSVMHVSVDDLYAWRLEKVGSHWETIQGEKYRLLKTATSMSGGGWAFFRDRDVPMVGMFAHDPKPDYRARGRVEPRYVVELVGVKEGRDSAVATKLPIGDSGAFCVFDGKNWGVQDGGTGSESTRGGESVSEVSKKAKTSVVKITVRSKEGSSTGTGFVVTGSGLILTNKHVVEGAVDDKVTVLFPDGTELAGTVKVRHDTYDLALVALKGTPKLLTVLEFARVEPKQGEEAVIIGHPANLEWTVTSARIAAFREESGIKWVQLDAPVNPGNSGGPLLNLEGRVIGVIYARAEKTGSGASLQNIGMAIPATVAEKFVQQSK